MYRRLIAEPAERLGALREVRYFVSAGERLSPELVKRWRDATGGELLNLYGMSETFCACMMTPPGTSDGLRTGTPFPAEVRLEAGVLWVRHPAPARATRCAERRRRSFATDGSARATSSCATRKAITYIKAAATS